MRYRLRDIWVLKRRGNESSDDSTGRQCSGTLNSFARTAPIEVGKLEGTLGSYDSTTGDLGTVHQGIAMDIVGPLPRSKSGHKYILVLCDYANRYPEAIPLRSIDAEHVAEELIKVFARVGIPQEILTDQGSNFMSQLLAELYRLLHVHSIRTSPYHLQTDGLVERFNQTLKSVLRKVVSKEGKENVAISFVLIPRGA